MLSDLPIPKVRDELSLHRVGSWDEETVDLSFVKSQKAREPSLTPHAVAFGSFVYGTRQSNSEDEPWFTWKVSFSPYRVCRVVSNQDGSVIVCSTDAGTLALLRGIDGSVLATRKVAAEEEGILEAAHISFLGRSVTNQTTDAVVIGVPNTDPSKAELDFLMVSNINYTALNDRDPLKVAEAARKMSIKTSLELGRGSAADILSFCGCFLGEQQQQTIRFVTMDDQENISVQDCSGSPDYQLSTVQESVAWKTVGRQDSSLDVDVGLRFHRFSNDLSFVFFCTSNGRGATIHCYDPMELCMSGFFDIPNEADKTRQKVLAVEGLTSAVPEAAVAIAVASRSGDNIIIHVLQARLVGRLLESPHIVYTFPVSNSVRSVSMAPLSLHSHGPYSFRYKVWQGSENYVCKSFSSRGIENSEEIGRIRLFIRAENFDEADQLISQAGEAALIRDPYADFHPSEVAVGRLRMILKEGDVCQKGPLTQAKLCFHRLASGCISGNGRASMNLLEAAEAIAQWAAPNNSSHNVPTLTEITTALSAIVKTISEVLNILPSERHPPFENKRSVLEDQLSALKYLSSVLPEDAEQATSFSALFQGSRSPGELFANFVAEGYFFAAETMWKSNLRPQLPPEVAVGSFLRLSHTADPRKYICLLEELVLPSLCINHELLPSIWIWACRLADELDDKNRIDDAIFLLESVERATNELQLRIHSSFASFSPFVERIGTRKARIADRKDTSSNSLHDTSFTSTSSTLGHPSKSTETSEYHRNCAYETNIPIPTVLETGRIKGGATKTRQRSSRVRNVKALVGEDTEEVTDCRLREKLLHARALKAARELGMERNVAALRSFVDLGGMRNFAKELAHSLSLSTKSHHERSTTLSRAFKSFCDQFGIDFDGALFQYIQELCSSTVASDRTIEEAASVAQCCTNVTKKCQCILVVLRAALFCGASPPWLKKLSQEAVEWASLDLSLRSELVEAARLLLVDGIVRRYIGNEGCSLFRVDNPRHAQYMADFVCQHYRDESVLNDALDLADAFNHLSRLDTCTNLCYQAIQGGSVEICTDICEKLYEKDSLLADSICAHVVAYCSELVTECAHAVNNDFPASRISRLKQNARTATCTACAVIPIALAHSRLTCGESLSLNPYSKVDFDLLEADKRDFSVIHYLQREFSIFGLSLSDIRYGPEKILRIASSLVDTVVKNYMEANDGAWTVRLTKVRRACSLLANSCECSENEFWCALVATVTSPMVWAYDDGRCLDCLSDLGVLGGFQTTTAICARTILSTAYCLCVKASNGPKTGQEVFFHNFGRAVSLLQDFCLVSCPKNLLIQTQSLNTLAETVWRVLLRGDEGVGENLEVFRKGLLKSCWSLRDPLTATENERKDTANQIPLLCRPNLHASWYISDGLLLPVNESITRSVQFSKELMGLLTSTGNRFGLGNIPEMTKFLCSRGALSVALRLLANSSVVLLCSRTSGAAHGSIGAAIQEVLAEGASRYVGGSGNGITSKMVDSEHAVCFLLSLPIKLAFKVYRSALPTALKTRDYARVLALANIGVTCGRGKLHTAWKNQDKFALQCQQLSKKAFWWVFLRKHKIDFDSRRFEGSDKKSSGESAGVGSDSSAYALSLVTPIIDCLLSTNGSDQEAPVQKILDVLSRYGEAFGLRREKVVECFVEFILSSPHHDEGDNNKDDIRLFLPKVDLTVRALLPLVHPVMRRASVLRRCVLSLERDQPCARDYERHSLCLSYYRKNLYDITEMEAVLQNIDTAVFEAELEAIDRRCDALAILASVFEGEKTSNRPPFPDFFPPLPVDISSTAGYSSPATNCDILGNLEMEGSFDPLKPLQETLLRSYDMNTSMALAPLCLPLGLPNGYIHARFLMEHFRFAARRNSTMPSFETDMIPVFSRIQSAGHKASLAEWCSHFFKENDQERLNCLDLALNCAIKHSSEAEQRKNRYVNSKCSDRKALDAIESEAMVALETVQRLSKAKSSLSDKITVSKALLGTGKCDDSVVLEVVKELIERINENAWETSQETFPTPEKVLEVLLSSGSLLAATRSLGTDPLSIQQFQQLTSLCSEACQALADDHSHIHTGHIADVLVRTWLFTGDDMSDEKQHPENSRGVTSSTTSMKPSRTTTSHLDDTKEEDTMNFVMDLSSIQQDSQDEDQLYCDEIERGNSADKNMTSDEEPSALKKSARERTEDMAKRVALRVAFVLACESITNQNEDTHHNYENKLQCDENSSVAANSISNCRNPGKTKTGGGLLARIEKNGSKQNTYALESARDLLHIVFAKPDIQCASRIVVESDRNQNQTVTFSMRHRALRAASILVPQEALQKIIEEQGYLAFDSTEIESSLKRCTFGAFVAKECEQIGMPLSHSDLGHISSMHFSSYARTLWRHFRDGDLKGSRGRLLLLLLELSLKDKGTETDSAFIELLLKEMGRLYLPRTLLLACECILSLKDDIAGSKTYASLLSTCNDTLRATIATSAKAILSELHRSVRSNSLAKENESEAISTLFRLGRVVGAFSDSVGGQNQESLCNFIGVLVDISTLKPSAGLLTKSIGQVVSNALRRVAIHERARLIEKVVSVPALREYCQSYATFPVA